MSVTSVPERVRLRLWGKAAGRCEYEGCSERLWLDTLTQVEFNVAYVAHIIADSADGPRGDEDLSPKLKAELSNLMLLCDKHHRLVDKEQVKEHSVERLQRMKREHEDRMELLGDLKPDKQSHVLLYGANIGDQSAALSLRSAAQAMLPEWYPRNQEHSKSGCAIVQLQTGAPIIGGLNKFTCKGWSRNKSGRGLLRATFVTFQSLALLHSRF